MLSNDGTRLFATLNGENRVVSVNTASGQVVARTTTGSQPRSMAMSSDGQALYVVNYSSNSVSVLKTSDLSVVRSFPVPDHPIGIAYEPDAPPRLGRVLQRHDRRLRRVSRGEVRLATR